MPKTTSLKRSTKLPAAVDNIDEDRRITLDRQLRLATSAFAHLDTAQERTDKTLYTAIGRLAEFVAAIGNDADSLITFSKEKGVKITKATPTAVAVTKLVVTTDRRKANKYATVLQFAALKGILPETGAVADFIANEGGIEACLRAYREMPREGAARAGAGRPTAYSQATSRVENLARVKAPKGLSVSALDDGYFIAVGVRDADGTLHFIQQPVIDEKLIKAVVTSIGKEG